MRTAKKTTYLAITLATSLCSASMVELWNTKKLTTESDSVRIGEVTSKWSSWDAEKKMIYTYVKLKVNETVKGQSQEEILIKQPGGELNGVGMRVHGMAVFEQGEKALIFLKKGEGGFPSVVGMAQGKFRIVKDTNSGEDRAKFTAPEDVEFVAPEAQNYRHHLDASTVNRDVLLKKLIQEIKEVR